MTIALILASGTIIAAFPSVESFLAASREARAVNIATFDLESCVEDFLSVPFKDVLRIYTNTDPNLNPLTRFTDLHLEGERMTAVFLDQGGNPVVGVIPPEPLHAVFDVTWTGTQGTPRTLTMSVARTR